MVTTNGLTKRVERLESVHGGPLACTTCGAGAGNGMAVAGGDSLPEWADLTGCCKNC